MENQNKPTFSISFSEYSTFMQCPHKWFLSYVLKVPGDTNEELIFGSALHDTIETILTNPVLKKMAQRDMSMTDSIFKDHLKKEIAGVKDINLLKKLQEAWAAPMFMKQAKGVLLELDIFKRFSDYEVADVEIKMDGLPIIELDTATLVYKGFTDMVLKHKKTGRYLIIDWKTSRKKWDINKKEEDDNFYTQLYLYKHFYSMKTGIPVDLIDLAFYNLPREEPNEQKMYSKEITIQQLNEFMNRFAQNCKKLYEFDHFQLDKMRFTTKKNFCHRCPYNNLMFCTPTDQYQMVELKQADLI